MSQVIYVLTILGLILSIYFLYVKNKQKKKKYKAICDINKFFSCSKATGSKYSNLFILPNALYGIVFYSSIVFLSYLSMFNYVFYLSIFASLLTVYLIYASIRIKVICPVCVTIYIINFLILWFSYLLI